MPLAPTVNNLKELYCFDNSLSPTIHKGFTYSHTSALSVFMLTSVRETFLNKYTAGKRVGECVSSIKWYFTVTSFNNYSNYVSCSLLWCYHCKRVLLLLFISFITPLCLASPQEGKIICFFSLSPFSRKHPNFNDTLVT